MKTEEKLFRLFSSFSNYPELLVRILMDRGAFDDEFLKDVEDAEFDTDLPELKSVKEVSDYCERLLEGRPTLTVLLKKAIEREDYYTASRLNDRLERGEI